MIFSFRVYLDEEIAYPGRDLLIVGGRPIEPRKIDSHTVEFVFAEPAAAGLRLFDEPGDPAAAPARRALRAGRAGRDVGTGDGAGADRRARPVPAARVSLRRAAGAGAQPQLLEVDDRRRPAALPRRAGAALRRQRGRPGAALQGRRDRRHRAHQPGQLRRAGSRRRRGPLRDAGSRRRAHLRLSGVQPERAPGRGTGRAAATADLVSAAGVPPGGVGGRRPRGDRPAGLPQPGDPAVVQRQPGLPVLVQRSAAAARPLAGDGAGAPGRRRVLLAAGRPAGRPRGRAGRVLDHHQLRQQPAGRRPPRWCRRTCDGSA